MYTVGIKRRFWFGFKEYQVKAHSWDTDRIILNLEDGSQIYIPGVRSLGVKVYPNFWIHLHSLPRQEPVRQEPVRAGAVAPNPVPVFTPKVDLETKPDPYNEDGYVEPTQHEYVSPEVKKRAAERVRGILQESVEA